MLIKCNKRVAVIELTVREAPLSFFNRQVCVYDMKTEQKGIGHSGETLCEVRLWVLLNRQWWIS